jgi:alkylation response protein AidB-like acyl-CoA dehydrogenase
VSAMVASVPLDVDVYRGALRTWLSENGAALTRPPPTTHEMHVRQGLERSRTLWEAGWKRAGWPELVGGIGGGPRLRATYYDEMCRAGFDLAETDSSIEVIGPAMLEFAPDLAERFLSRYLAGDEIWGQGFSEPDAGSDLASLRTRAIADGDVVVVDGQKVWTSHGHIAERLLTLVRTGSTESRHRGLAALLIDTDLPGIARRPLTFASGDHEMCETFFDGVRVPDDRFVGARDQGWQVAMFMLQYERSMYAAQRQAHLGLRLRQLGAHLALSGHDGGAAEAIGGAWLQLQAVRARAIESVQRLDAGEVVGPDASADKVLLARAEQAILEAARHLEGAAFAFDESAERWRAGWWYSRASSLLGGAGEIQRSIVADRVLGLPREVD